MAKYVNVSAIKKLAKENGKRTGSSFIEALDRFIEEHVIRAARTHDGGKKTLDTAIASYVGIK